MSPSKKSRSSRTRSNRIDAYKALLLRRRGFKWRQIGRMLAPPGTMPFREESVRNAVLRLRRDLEADDEVRRQMVIG